MWQLSEAVDGMREACLALGLPVVGGNVSLYNESDGVDIDPTPVIATVGVLDEIARRPPSLLPEDGDTLVLVGPASSDLSGSAYNAGRGDAWRTTLPGLDLELHARLIGFVAATRRRRSGRRRLRAGARGSRRRRRRSRTVLRGDGCRLRRRVCAVEESSIGTALFSEAPSRVVFATPRPDEIVAVAALTTDCPRGDRTGRRRASGRRRATRPHGRRAAGSTFVCRIPEALGEFAGAEGLYR